MLCAGEALTDMIDQGGEQWVSRVGGSTWNVACALAALGEAAAFAGAIGPDRFGDALWRASEAAGLDTRLLQRVDRSALLAVVEQGEPPRYFFSGDDSADPHFKPALLPAGWPTACAGPTSAASAWRANPWRRHWWRWRAHSRRAAWRSATTPITAI